MAKILIVDDEPLITVLMEDWLWELGHEVIGPAHNLARALALADSDIDAAIVDVTLGKENSYPLVDALIGRDLPLALATGHGQDGMNARYRAQSMLRKPFDFATVRRTTDELLRANRARSAIAACRVLPQRRIDRAERFRPRAQFALRQLVERPVGRSQNLVQFIGVIIDIDEAGGDLARDPGALQRGERR